MADGARRLFPCSLEVFLLPRLSKEHLISLSSSCVLELFILSWMSSLDSITMMMRRRRRLSIAGEIEADESGGYVVYLHMKLMVLSNIYLIICDCNCVKSWGKVWPDAFTSWIILSFLSSAATLEFPVVWVIRLLITGSAPSKTNAKQSLKLSSQASTKPKLDTLIQIIAKLIWLKAKWQDISLTNNKVLFFEV